MVLRGLRHNRVILDDITSHFEKVKRLRDSERLGFMVGTLVNETVWGIRFGFFKDVPDSGQEHPANGDDGFLMAATRFQTLIPFSEFRVLFGTDERIGNLNKERLQIRTSPGDTGRFDRFGASIIARTAASPGTEMFGRGKDRHISSDFR